MTVQEALDKLDKTVTGDLEWKIVLTEALEKQIPKKPTEIHEKEDKYSSFYTLSFMCPSCETAVIFQPYKPKYCKHCGQKLDWGD